MSYMEKPFDYWQDHSETFLIMANLWDKRKTVEKPDGYGKKTGDCGDTVAIYLGIKNGVINAINYELQGCMNTNACCNALATLAEGKMVEQSWEITPKDIIDFLETLPIDHHHCAELTVGTFYLALVEWSAGKGNK
jgi:nitrogen fixation protein NifU and related proteins